MSSMSSSGCWRPSRRIACHREVVVERASAVTTFSASTPRTSLLVVLVVVSVGTRLVRTDTCTLGGCRFAVSAVSQSRSTVRRCQSRPAAVVDVAGQPVPVLGRRRRQQHVLSGPTLSATFRLQVLTGPMLINFVN